MKMTQVTIVLTIGEYSHPIPTWNMSLWQNRYILWGTDPPTPRPPDNAHTLVNMSFERINRRITIV